jgi:hypothetical protein
MIFVAIQEQKTYNSGYSLVVTHLTTNPPVRCLNRAERTGSLVLNVLWSYVFVRNFGKFTSSLRNGFIMVPHLERASHSTQNLVWRDFTFLSLADNYRSLTDFILQTLFAIYHSISVNTHTCTEACSYLPLVRVQILSDEQASATMSAGILLSDLSTKRVLVQVKKRLESTRNKDSQSTVHLATGRYRIGFIDWMTGDICAPPGPRGMSESDPDCKTHGSAIRTI